MSTRRDFLGAAAIGASALASTLNAAKTAQTRTLGANDRINVGVIGVGTRGFGHLRVLKHLKETTSTSQIVAISDIYTRRKEKARDFLGLTDKDIHHEYHDLLARPDVDAVVIATPDHWHFRMAMDAMLAGKDVYVEKPMTYKIEEAKVLADHVKKSGRVMQVGSQYASELIYFKAKELMAENIIGKPLFAQGTYSRNSYHGEWDYTVDPEGTKENIDWKRFLGSAPKRDFNADRYFRWRKYWDYSGGISTDLLYHRLTPFMQVLGPQFPTRVSANGGIYVHKDREVPDTISTCVEYPDFQVIMSSSMASGAPIRLIPPAIIGHEASMEFIGNKEIVITAEPIFAKKFKEKHGDTVLHIPITPTEMGQAHMENFLDCMRTRKAPNLDADFGYKVMVAIGLGVEAYKGGKQMTWDARAEKPAKSIPKRDSYEGDGKNVDETVPV